jgi:hypothetical protein
VLLRTNSTSEVLRRERFRFALRERVCADPRWALSRIVLISSVMCLSRDAHSAYAKRSHNCYGEGNRFDVASGLPVEAGAGEVSAARGSSDS